MKRFCSFKIKLAGHVAFQDVTKQDRLSDFFNEHLRRGVQPFGLQGPHGKKITPSGRHKKYIILNDIC